MRAIVIFATLTAAVLARPDVSHLQGYKYKQPGGGSGSNGYASSGGNTGFNGGNNYAGNGHTDSASFGSSSVSTGLQFNGGFNGGSGDSLGAGANGDGFVSGSGFNDFGSGSSSGNGGSSQPIDLGAIGANGFSSGSSGSNGFSSGSSGANGFSSGSSGSNGFSSGSSGANGFSSGSSGANGFSSGSSGNDFSSGSGSNSFSGSSSNGFGGGNGGINLIQGQSQTLDLTGGSSGGQRVVYRPVIKHGEPIVTKNFYVHAAPEEDENVRVEEKVQVVRPQKTYKIIFIKAPSASPSISAAQLQQFPQNEEKTIVYVLSKKDEGVTDFGEIPTPPPSVTHKPEVFFIKYKTKQEAADAVANIQAQFQSDTQSSNAASGTSFNLGGSSNGASFGSQNGNKIDSSSEVIVQSSGTATLGNAFETSIAQGDIRIDDDNLDTSSLGLNNEFESTAAGINGGISGIQGISSSSQSSFGPTGGQATLQTSQFGPSGGQTFTQSAQIPSSGDQPIVQSTFTQSGGNGQSSYTDSNGSSAEFIPQKFIKIDTEQSAFQQKYLPPNGCSNC